MGRAGHYGCGELGVPFKIALIFVYLSVRRDMLRGGPVLDTDCGRTGKDERGSIRGGGVCLPEATTAQTLFLRYGGTHAAFVVFGTFA